MEQENYHGHDLQQPPQQQPNAQLQPQQQLQGFAPRRQYDNLSGSTAAIAAACLANGGGGTGAGAVAGGAIAGNSNLPKTTPTGALQQRPAKVKKEKPALGGAQQQSAELAASGSSGILPTEEALKFVNETDANGLAMKTPVSVLQELLSRRGITPGYELVQIEGAIHEPTFRFRVSFKDKDTPFTAMGAGRSKKEAKHAAARALIDKLLGGPLPDSPSSGGVGSGGVAAGANSSAVGSSASGSAGDGNANVPGSGGDAGDKIVGNPIGWLQEMCMQRRWPPPSYETETEVGLPHERLFTIACTILNYREVGKGKSKKIAKRLAAHKMWTRLQETPIDAAKINDSICSELEAEVSRPTIDPTPPSRVYERVSADFKLLAL